MPDTINNNKIAFAYPKVYMGQNCFNQHTAGTILIICFVLMLLSPLLYAKSFDEIDQNIVCIKTYLKKGQTRTGTGFFVNKYLIATVDHQVKYGQSYVYRSDGTKTRAKLIARDPKHDLALLSVPENDNGYLTLDFKGKLKLGEDIFTIGCPLGFEHSLSRGIISHVKRTINRKKLIQVDLTVNEGNSGGPLLNGKGDVIGVIWGKLEDSTNINFAIPVDQLKILIKNKKINPNLMMPPALQTIWNKALEEKNPKKQLQYYQYILKKIPDAAEVYYNQGLVYYKINQFMKAKNSFKKAAELKQDYYQAYSNLGLSYNRLGEYKDARKALIRSISINADYAPAYLNLGIVYDQGLDDKKSARRAFQKYLKLKPESGAAKAVKQRIREIKNQS